MGEECTDFLKTFSGAVLPAISMTILVRLEERNPEFIPELAESLMGGLEILRKIGAVGTWGEYSLLNLEMGKYLLERGDKLVVAFLSLHKDAFDNPSNVDLMLKRQLKRDAMAREIAEMEAAINGGLGRGRHQD
jgi:hypothetical protein